MEWSGVEWSGVEWSGVEWSGAERSGVEWIDLMMIQGKSRLGVLLFLTLLACGGMLTLAYAQSGMGSAFNLNSPASFPVDI